jgi:cation diffusion facilitator CzcD-associated flavoprotein CzcO
LCAQAEWDEVLVVGAGPHALTLVAWLLDPEPMPRKFVDGSQPPPEGWREHDAEVERRAVLARKREEEGLRPPLAVVDASGGWMARWDRQFATLELEHLRSHTAMHPDPVSPMALPAFIRRHKLEHCRVPITHIKRTREFHGPFHLPSTELFRRFCKGVVERYRMDRLVVKDSVSSIVPLCRQRPDDGTRETTGFRVEMKSGAVRFARRVVVSVGHTNQMSVPDWCSDFMAGPASSRVLPVRHSWELSPADTEAARGKRVLIVGGGLTAAHLIVAATRKGCSVVWITRGPLRVRQFDLEVEWMGRKRLGRLGPWMRNEDAGERLAIARQVRTGGSITPELHKVLNQLPRPKPGTRAPSLLPLHETDVWAVEWEEAAKEWVVDCSSEDHPQLRVDLIWLATGSRLDAAAEPLFREVLKEFPIPLVSGLPDVTPSLKWHPHCDLYVTGAYAQLRLGPDAVNLGGARRAACRLREELCHATSADKWQCTRAPPALPSAAIA